MKYRTVHEGLFSDPKYLEASAEMRWLMVSLLISPHGNLIGCFRLPKSYFSDDTGYPIDRVSEGLRYHNDTGFIRYCDVTGWVWIRRYLRYHPVAGPKQATAANNLLACVPKEACFLNELRDFFSDAYKGGELPKPYPIDRVSIPPARVGAGEQEQEQEQESKGSANADSSSPDDDDGETITPDDGSSPKLDLGGAEPEDAKPPGEPDLATEAFQKVLALIPLDLDSHLFSDACQNPKKQQIRARLAADFTDWESDNAKFEAQLELVVKALRADDGAREKAPAPLL